MKFVCFHYGMAKTNSLYFILDCQVILPVTRHYFFQIEKNTKKYNHAPFFPDLETMSSRLSATITFTGSSFFSGMGSDFLYAGTFPSCNCVFQSIGLNRNTNWKFIMIPYKTGIEASPCIPSPKQKYGLAPNVVSKTFVRHWSV